MSPEWPKVPLGDLIDIDHGFAFQGEFFREDPPGDVLLTPGNFAIGGGFKADKVKYYSGPVPDEFVLKSGDLLVTMTDLSKTADTLGYPAVVPRAQPGTRFLHNQRLGKVKIRCGVPLESRFLYYLLCSREYRNEVIASATGSTVKHTSPSRIRAFCFDLPARGEQRAIGRILGALDDKIELNRRMNETLEAMARALFKSWFVDFDPVRAKAEGRDPGLPKPIADLFPTRLVDTEFGEIPDGWDLQSFTETVAIIGGGTPKTSVAAYWNGDMPWFSVVDAPIGAGVWVVDTQKKITRAGVENSSTRILPVGATIISARGTVGRLALVGVPMAMNQSCYGIIGKVEPSGSFTYFTTKELVASLQQHAHGSVFDTITRDTLTGVSVVVPPKRVIETFETIAGPFLERARQAVLNSRTIAAARDALLPKLISGELRIGGTGGFADGVT